MILTPSKITIEHSSDYPKPNTSKQNKEQKNVNGGCPPKHNSAYESSPIHWNYAQNHNVEVSVSNDRTDFIEVISEPEELCRSHCPNNSIYQNKTINCRKSNGSETPKKHKQYDDDSNYNDSHDANSTFSIWETSKENNEDSTAQTIIFHHKSDVGENCCDNYCQHNNESDTDIEMNICTDRSSNSIIYSNAKCDEETNLKSNKYCCKSLSSLTQLELLNNAMPLSSHVINNNTNSNNNNSNSSALTNFQKNNISQIELNRFLDLSSDIRRYSKITNFEQQNASNLLPNYFSRSSLGNLSESQSNVRAQRQNNQNLLVSILHFCTNVGSLLKSYYNSYIFYIRTILMDEQSTNCFVENKFGNASTSNGTTNVASTSSNRNPIIPNTQTSSAWTNTFELINIAVRNIYSNSSSISFYVFYK